MQPLSRFLSTLVERHEGLYVLAVVALLVSISMVLRASAMKQLRTWTLDVHPETPPDSARRRLAMAVDHARARLRSARWLSLPGLAGIAFLTATVETLGHSIRSFPSVAFGPHDLRVEIDCATRADALTLTLVAGVIGAIALVAHAVLLERERHALGAFQTVCARAMNRIAFVTAGPPRASVYR